MCGIMGYYEKSGARQSELGATMMQMLVALGRRGPDSAGLAFYTDHGDGACALQIKLDERGECTNRAALVLQQVTAVTTIREHRQDAEYLRLIVDEPADPRVLEEAIEAVHPAIEVISFGRALEIIKQTGSPDNLDRRFHISGVRGTHAIAHTRLSTESRIDLSHSQPFWAHGCLDVASVHNGHITNYHKLRRQYEERGIRFYTENDSEIIGIYLAEALAAGATLYDALEGCLRVFDGSFSFLAATAGEIGFAKDPFGFKPLIVTETDDFVALATEEHALRHVFGEDVTTWEPPPGVVRTWPVERADVSRTCRAPAAPFGAPSAIQARSAHGSR